MSKYNGKTPNCKCVVCKKGLYEPPSVLKRRKKFFCSKECKAAYGSKLKIYECENCKKEFPRYPSETKKGVTLCETCHDKFHSIYGKTDNNLFQFSQFKESYQLIK